MSASQSNTVRGMQNAFHGEKKWAEKVKPKIKLWQMKETSCQKAFRQEVTRILGDEGELLMSGTK